MSYKKIFKGITVAISAYLLVFALLFLANAVVFRYVAANPDKIKNIVAGSGTYERLPEVIYEGLEAQSQAQDSDIKFSDPAVKQAALESFNPEFFQTNIEPGIDNTYSWLEGKTKQLDFAVDITNEKKAFVNRAVDLQAEKAKALPKCTAAQLRQMELSTVNLYNLECLPPGINISSQAEKAKQELLNNPEFLSDTRFDAKDLKDKSGQPLVKEGSSWQEMFQAAKNLPVVLALASILLLATIYYASSSRRAAAKLLAKIFIPTGIFLLLAPVLMQFVSGKILPISSGEKIVSDVAGPIVAEYNNAAAVYYYWLGGLLCLVGAGLLIYLIRTKSKVKSSK